MLTDFRGRREYHTGCSGNNISSATTRFFNFKSTFTPNGLSGNSSTILQQQQQQIFRTQMGFSPPQPSQSRPGKSLYRARVLEINSENQILHIITFEYFFQFHVMCSRFLLLEFLLGCLKEESCCPSGGPICRGPQPFNSEKFEWMVEMTWM